MMITQYYCRKQKRYSQLLKLRDSYVVMSDETRYNQEGLSHLIRPVSLRSLLNSGFYTGDEYGHRGGSKSVMKIGLDLVKFDVN